MLSTIVCSCVRSFHALVLMSFCDGFVESEFIILIRSETIVLSLMSVNQRKINIRKNNIYCIK